MEIPVCAHTVYYRGYRCVIDDYNNRNHPFKVLFTIIEYYGNPNINCINTLTHGMQSQQKVYYFFHVQVFFRKRWEIG